MLADIRPDDWNLPLFLHVLGSMLTVGTLVAAVLIFTVGWRRDEPTEAAALARRGYRTLLLGVVPSFVFMRVTAQWIYSKEFGDSANDPTWIGFGYLITDMGALVLIVALVLAGLGARRLRRDGGNSSALSRAAAVLSGVLLAAYVVAVWAMTVKPD